MSLVFFHVLPTGDFSHYISLAPNKDTLTAGELQLMADWDSGDKCVS